MEELKSQAGPSEPAILRFVNQRQAPMLSFWLDYEGRPVPYGTVQPQTTLEQATYSGHAWRLCDDASGAVVCEYLGPSASILAAADGSVRVVSTSESVAEAQQQQQAAGTAARAVAEAASEEQLT